MGQSILLKRSAIPGKKPSANSLNLGEIALNTYDGRIFFKRSGSLESVQEVITTNAVNTGSINLYGGVDNQNYLLNITGYNNYFQGIYLQNLSNSTSASSDVAIYNDDGTSYVNIGINSTTYQSSSEAFTTLGKAGDAYVFSAANDLYIGNASTGKRVILFNGEFNTEQNAKITIHDQGSLVINTGQSYNETYPEALVINPRPDSNFNLVSVYNNVNNYSQINTKNLSSGPEASTDIVVTADNGDEVLYYANLGINSSQYSAGNVGYANDGYLINAGKNFYVGTKSDDYYGTNPDANLYLFANSAWDNPEIMISGSHVVGFGTQIVTDGYKYEFDGGNVKINNNLLVLGTITAQNLIVQTITSSTQHITGSTRFGSLLTNTHDFTGSVRITSSLTVNGPIDINGDSTIQGNQFNAGTYWKEISGSNLPSGPWRGIAYGNGLFVAVANRGASGTSNTTSLATSPDGVNWTFRTLPTLAGLTNIVYQNGLFVAIGQVGSQRGFYSYDGINWFNTTVLNGQLYGITYGKDKFVATKIDNSLNRIDISYNGKNWQGVSTPSTMDLSWTSVTYANDRYVAVAESTASGSIAISYDGLSWNNVTRPSAGTLTTYNITYGKGLFVVTCSQGKIMTSPDGINWTVRDTPLTGLIWKCIFAEGVFIAAGAFSTTENRFIYSTDGITWEEATTPALNSWSGFAYGNGLLVAVSFNGTDSNALVVSSGVMNSFVTQNDNITHGRQTFTDDVIISASLNISGSQRITGNLIVSGGITGSLLATNGVVSGSSQIDITQTTGYTSFSQSLSGTDASQSVSILISSQSAWGAFQSASAFSASAAIVDNAQTLRLNSIESFTSSIAATNVFTASTNASLTALNVSTASINTFTASTNASLIALNTSTASLNSKTGSYATTGSNVFQGNQTINGTLNVTNIVVTTITASTEYASGSTRFGSSNANTHEFTGSVRITGSLDIVGGVIATSFGGIINANNGVVSGSSQIDVTQTTGYTAFSQSLAGTDISQSVSILISSQSAWGAFQSASANSSSAATVDNVQNVRLNSLEVFTSSIAATNLFTASIAATNTFTASVNNSLNSINSKTGSYATTGSNQFIGNQTINGSLIVSGTTGTTLLSSNVDTLLLTGSAIITGSLVVTGSLSVSGFITGSLLSTNGVISGSSQVTLTSTTGYTTFSQSLAGTDESQSVSILITSQSAWGAFQSASTFSSSAATVDNLQNVRLNSLEGFTASVTNINSFTQSVNSSLTALNLSTSSVSNFTSSANASLTALNLSTASLNSKTGSYATTGSNVFQGNQTINGTLNVTNIVVTTITASTEYASGSTRFGSNNFNTHEFTGSVRVTGSLDVIGGVTATSFAGTINANNGVVSGSSQINLTQTTGYTTFSQSFAGTDESQSVSILITSQSAFGAFQSASAFSSSAATVDNAQNVRLNSLEGFTASVTNINSFTASTNASLTALNLSTASLNSKTGSYAITGSNSFTGNQTISTAFSAGNYPLSLYDGVYNFNFGFYASGIGGNRLSIYRNASQTYFDNSSGNFYFNAPLIATSFAGTINANNGVVSASSQIDVTQSTGYTTFSQSLAGTDTSQSLSILITSQSAWGAFQSASAFSSSAATVDNAQNVRLNSLESFTASVTNINQFTQSVNNSLTALNVTTSSLNNFTASVAGTNTFTSSTNASLNALNLSTSSVSNFTSSANASLTALNLSTASVSNFTASANSSLTALNLSTASLNSKTGSYATTGSNVFQGNQTINGTLNVTNIVVTTITASTEYASGSTRFGSNNSNTHEFTGSVKITGSLDVLGPINATSFAGTINSNNGVISGSSQLNGTTIQNLSGSFTGSYTGSFIGTFNGNLTGVAGFASTVATVTTGTTTDTTLYPMFSATPSPNTYITPTTHPSGSFFYNGVTRIVHAEGFSGSIYATNGVVSGSSQIDVTQTTGYTTFSQSLAGTNQSASLSTLVVSQSAWGAFQSASAFSSSAATVDNTQNVRLNTIETFTSSANTRMSNLEIRTGSYTTTSSFNSFTQSYYADSASFDTRIQTAIAGATPAGAVSSSIQIDITQTTGYTTFSQSLAGTDASQSVSILITSQSAWGAFQSASAFSSSAATVDNTQNVRLNSVENFTSSIVGTNTFTASIAGTNQFTQSANLRLNSLESFTSSFSASNSQTDATQSLLTLISSQSAWGAFQSASAFSSSAATVDNAQNIRLNLLETYTGSTTNSLTALNLSTASFNNFTASTNVSLVALNLSTASLNSKTGSYATTGSNTFQGNQTINGTLNVTNIVVTTITASTQYSSGSNIFGSELTNIQQFTGSLRVTGSANHWIVGGNVGIGTTSPNRGNLTVNGNWTDVYTSGNGQLAVLSNVSSSNASGSGNGAVIVLGGFASDADPGRTFVSIGGFKENNIADNRAGYFSIGVRSGVSGNAEIIERLRINSSGSVGIGTTNPAFNFDVSGSGRYTNGLVVTGSLQTTGGITGSILANNGVVSGSSQIDITATSGYTTLSQSLAGTDQSQSVSILITSQSVWGAFQSASAFSSSAATVDNAQNVRLNSIETFTSSIAGTNTFTASIAGINTFTASIAGTNVFTQSVNLRLNALETTSASVISRIGSIESFTSSFSSSNATIQNTQNIRLNSLESRTGSYATTGSNTFVGNQIISGSITITQDLVVLGSSSIQNITSSQLNIGTNLITVNAQAPAVRFGGLAVIDSGSSPQRSGSLLFDSTKDQWVFVHQNQTVITSSVLLIGPETYDNFGNETYLTLNRLPKGSGVEHLRDSNITDTGVIVSINSNTQITGSLTMSGSSEITASIIGNPFGDIILEAKSASLDTGSVEIHGGLKWKRIPSAVPTEIGDLITFGGTMGLIEGGNLTTSSVGGLVVQVSPIVGYTMDTFAYGSHNIQKFNTLNSSDASRQLTLPQTSSVYVYYNSSATLTYNTTAPSTRNNIILGKVTTDASNIIYIDASQINAHHYSNYIDRLLREGLGPIFSSGGIATQGTISGSINVSAATYFFSQNRITTNAGTNISMDAFYRSTISGQYVRVAGVTNVNSSSYDNGSGTLTTIPAGKYTKHSLYMLGDNSLQATAREAYMLVYGQSVYDTLGDAQAGTLPTPPSFFNDSIAIIASIIVTPSSSSIQSILDERPRLGFISPSKTGVLTAHGDLTGLTNDDHTQYLLTDGTRTLTGNMNLGGFNISNASSISATSVTGSIRSNNGVVSGSSQIDLTQITNYTSFSQSLAGTDASQSVSILAASQSAWGAFQSASAFSSSAATVDNIQNIRLNSLEAFTSSVININSFTQSVNASLSALNLSTASVSNFTASANSSLTALNLSTASLNSKTGSYATTGSNTFQGNQTINGTLNVTNIVVTTITASTEFASGSTRFGSNNSNTHEFTGSVRVTGSLDIIGGVTATSFAGTINANNGVISGSSQITLSSIIGYTTFSQSLAGTDQSQSVNILITSQSAWGAFQSASAFSSSAATVDNLQNVRLNSIESFTSSVAGTNTFTASANASLTSINSRTGSYATTGSNTFIGNQTISGNVIIGSASVANENTLILGVPIAGGTGEGGQILLAASGGLYTSASMIDNWQNFTRILRGTNAASDAVVTQWNMHTKQVSFPAYNSVSAFAGTAVANLAVDSGGNILTVSSSVGSVFPYTGIAAINGGLVVTGSITASGAIHAQANGTMYFRGGDDAELWDINVANTIGVYGQQDQTVASIKLGSGGGTISGRNGNIGIGTITPNSASLHVVGNVFATSFTGSLLANNGVVSGSSQIDITQTTGYTTFSQSLSGTDQSQSVSILAASQSAWGAFQSASAFSSSAANVDNVQNIRLNAVENFTASVTNINSFTQSVNASLTALNLSTSSLNNFTASVAGTNTFTQSANLRLNSLESTSASVISRVNSIESFTSSFSSSNATVENLQNIRLNSIESFTASVARTNTFTASVAGTNLFTASIAGTNTFTASANASLTALNLSTASISNFTASANASLTALNLSTASLNSKTGSYATTGSNTFQGNQTINGTLNVTNIIVTTITASTEYASGSTRFGSNNSNTHEFTGSVRITGSLDVVGGLTATSFAGTINANNGVISGSSQVTLTSTIGYTTFSQSFAGTDQSASVSILITSQSAWGAFQSASANSSSAATVDNVQNIRLNSLESFTASVTNINAFTQSVNSSLTALNLSTASLNSKTGSYAITGSNRFVGNQTITGSAIISGSVSIIASGSSVFTVDGVSGRLFSIDDSLSGSLFSVNTAAGLPLMEAFSDNTIRIGQYGQRALFVSQSRVGIGLENPTTNLHISGTTGGVFEVDGANAVNALYVSSSGNVGIGTTSPTYKLDVSGSAQFYKTSTDYLQLLQDSNSITFSPNAPSYFKYGSVTIISMKSGGANSTILHGAGTPILSATSVGVSIGQNVDGSVATAMLQVKGSGSASTSTAFRVENALATASLVVLDNGNIGIGTTTPTAKLQVTFPANTTNHIFRSDAGDNLLALQTFPTTNRMQLLVGDYNGTATPNIAAISDSNTGIQWTGSDVLKFVNNSTESVTLSAVGNVGIGLTPSSYLDVKGLADTAGVASLQLRSGNSSNVFNSNQILFGYANTAEFRHAIKTRHNSGAASGNAIDFYTWRQGTDSSATIGTQHVMSLDGANVGVGITSPAAKLHISGTTGGLFEVDGANAVNALYVSSSGNVGIGTTTPSAILHSIGTGIVNIVQSTNTVSYTQYYNTSTGNNSTSDGLTIGNNGTAAYIYQREADALIFGTSNIEAARITSTGNVGIGTTSPQTGVKLDVSGSVAIAGGTEGLRLGNIGDNSAYDNVKLYYTGFNSSAPRVYLTPRTTPGSGIVNSYFHLLNSNGTSTTSNNTMGLLVDGNVGIGTVSPTNKLHVVGSTLLSGSITGSGNTLINGNLTTTGSLNVSGSNYSYAGFSTAVGANTISSIPTASYNGAFYNYIAVSGSNARAGQISAIWIGNTITYTETTTTDIGNTNGVSMAVQISSGLVQLIGTTTSTPWIIKTSINLI